LSVICSMMGCSTQARTNLSAFEVPRNEQHSADLRRRTDRVMTAKAAPYVYGVTKQRGGLDSFEGRIRARRSDGKAVAGKGGGDAAKGNAVKGSGSEGAAGGVEEVWEEKWDEAVEGVSRVFRYALGHVVLLEARRHAFAAIAPVVICRACCDLLRCAPGPRCMYGCCLHRCATRPPPSPFANRWLEEEITIPCTCS